MAIQDHELKGTTGFVAEVRDENGATRVSFAGELDLSNAGALRELLVSPEILGAPDLRVDLSDVTFLDSSVIGVLATACKRKRSSGGTFSVRCRPGIARSALEVCGVLEYLHAEDIASTN